MKQLPSNWPTIRAAVQAAAGGRCEWVEDDQRCEEKGTDADHAGAPDDHNNLRWLCSYHHRARTARQGAEHRAAQAAKLRFPG